MAFYPTGTSDSISDLSPVTGGSGSITDALTILFGGATTASWSDVLANSVNSGPYNPTIDTGQQLLLAGTAGITTSSSTHAAEDVVSMVLNALSSGHAVQIVAGSTDLTESALVRIEQQDTSVNQKHYPLEIHQDAKGHPAMRIRGGGTTGVLTSSGAASGGNSVYDPPSGECLWYNTAAGYPVANYLAGTNKRRVRMDSGPTHFIWCAGSLQSGTETRVLWSCKGNQSALIYVVDADNMPYHLVTHDGYIQYLAVHQRNPNNRGTPESSTYTVHIVRSGSGTIVTGVNVSLTENQYHGADYGDTPVAVQTGDRLLLVNTKDGSAFGSNIGDIIAWAEVQ